MTFYWIIWVALVLLATRYTPCNKRKNNISTVLILIISLIVGCRFNVGADWVAYVDEYHESKQSLLFAREPLFLFIEQSMSRLSIPYPWFFFVLSCIHLFVLKKVITLFGIYNEYISLLLFFSLFFCMHILNIVRYGLMIDFLWLGLAYLIKGNTKKFYLSLLVGSGFHIMCLVFSVLPLFITKAFSKKVLVIMIVGAFFIYISGLSSIIYNYMPYLTLIEAQINSYINPAFESENSSFSLGQIFDLSVGLFCFFKYNVTYKESVRMRVLVNSLVIAFMVHCVFHQYTILTERFCQAFKFSLLFIFPILIELLSKRCCEINKTELHLHNQDMIQTLINRNKYAFFLMILIIYSMMYMNKTAHTPDPLQFKQYEFLPFNFELSNYLFRNRI